ncbi:hypothetical protein, partial [Vibrio anguillarum]|uniref:hypothetical protein n=1 Tax=Vibrio anguillarum TaxID=55601 RepID=UPI001BE49776
IILINKNNLFCFLFPIDYIQGKEIFNLNHIPVQEYIFDNISVVLGKNFRKFFLLIEQKLPLFDNSFY